MSKLCCLIAACFLFSSVANAQILVYTTDTTGVDSFIAANASGTSLSRVNGATSPTAHCGAGYTSTNFSTATSYSSSLPAVQTSATANTGYQLNVTGFSVDLRRSANGPQNVRYAYSTDGGTTWTDQGLDQNPNNGSCGSTITATWSTALTVASSVELMFRVYGFNVAGSGGNFQIMNLIINGTVSATSGGCGTPTGLVASSVTTTSALISWMAVTGATSYNVQYRPVGSSTWSTATATTLSTTLSGLTCGTNYEYQVQAVCASGSGSYTASSTFTTVACTSSCASPTALTASAITTSSATLSWTAASGATSYNIQYRPVGSSTWSTGTSVSASLSVTGLSCGTTYEFQVQTVCASGTGTFTASTDFTTLACATSACGAVTGLVPSPSALTTTSATISWTAVTSAISYNIRYRVVGTTTWSATTATSTSTTLTGLTCNTSYEFEVQSVCSAGDGVFSASTTFTTLACSSSGGSTGNHIAIYFNFPVNTAVSTGVNANYLTHGFVDTLIAYVHRAQYSIDLAVYDFEYSSYMAPLIDSINAAYARGITVRIILDGSETSGGINTAIPYFSSGIPIVNSPVTSYYIMHDKMMIFDAGASDPNKAVVSLTSADYSGGMFNASTSYNNMVFIQDSSFAHVCTDEFNFMWGSTTATHGTGTWSTSKPHIRKHNFTIDGKTVELYFSPTDTVNNHVISSINSANTDLYVGMFTFTNNTNATAMIARQTAGAYVSAILDQSSNPGTAYTTVSSGLGANFKEYTGSYRYHNKFMIVDPNNPCSDPQVLTGSFNWTSQANTSNDEDYIIIHSDTIANIYYQSYNHNFSDLGGTLTTITPPCSTSSCPMPTDVTITSITTTSSVVSWTSAGGATSYVIRYRIVGSGTWSTTTSTSTTVTLTGLTPYSIYEVQVQAVCSTTSSSTFTGSGNFSTGVLETRTIGQDCSSINMYPNPTNDNVTIQYKLTSENNVNIEVYNIVGQKVSTVVSNNLQAAGAYTQTADLPAQGVYFVRFTIGTTTVTKKVEKI